MTDFSKTKKWIEKVIKSCNTWDQITTCEKLIKNFKIQMGKCDYDNMISLPYIVDLEYKITLKRKELVEISNVFNN
jgi:hypothetical protein